MKEKIKMIGSIIILLFMMILSIVCFAFAAKKNERIVDNREKETIIITTTTAMPQVSDVITEEITENLTETSYNSNTTTTTTTTPAIITNTTELKSNEEIANEVIEGKWGNGEERKRKLIEAGYDWQEIQNKVNESCPVITTTVKKTNTSSENNSEISENNSETDTTESTKNNTEPKESMRPLGILKITGYTHTGKPTASGEMPYVGGVAMSRSYGLPFGTKIYIEGLGTYTLNDTGCKYGVVDVFCSTRDECYALTSHKNVYIVE